MLIVAHNPLLDLFIILRHSFMWLVVFFVFMLFESVINDSWFPVFFPVLFVETTRNLKGFTVL